MAWKGVQIVSTIVSPVCLNDPIIVMDVRTVKIFRDIEMRQV